MAAGVFRIEELARLGSSPVPGTPDAGEVFEWSADKQVKSPAGGAFAAPLKLWQYGGKLNHVRTDYPGALRPSEQVLNAVQKDQSYHGVWDDRYNFPGFAVGEMRRFEAMCQRANMVRVSFQAQSFEGLITEWDFPYEGSWRVGYQFTLSVHGRVDDPPSAQAVGLAVAVAVSLGAGSGLNRSPQTAPSPEEAMAAVDVGVQAAFGAAQGAPRTLLVADTADGVDVALGGLGAARDALSATVDGRQLAPALKPLDAWRRIGTQMRTVRAAAAAVVLRLQGARSDLSLGTLTGMGVLNFEEWSRSLRYFGRQVMGQAAYSADQLEARSSPPSVRTYRAQAGETLYHVSQRFYGTPFGWGMIADRNALTKVKLDGGELLVIPERGEG